MLLAADLALLDGAIEAAGTEWSAELISEKFEGRNVSALVIRGDATSDSNITVDTDYFGVAVDVVRIFGFDHVTIEGNTALNRAVVGPVLGAAVDPVLRAAVDGDEELRIEAPILKSLYVMDVDSIKFDSPLPAKVAIFALADARVEAPSFANTLLFGDTASLTLVSGKAHDSLNFSFTKLEDQKVILSFIPDKLTLNSSIRDIEHVNDMFQIGDGTKLHLSAEWIHALSLEQFQAIWAGLLPPLESKVGHFELTDLISALPAAKAVESLSLPPPSLDNLHAGASKFELPDVFVVDLSGEPHAVAELNLIVTPATPAPVTPVSDLVVSFVASEVVSAARIGPVGGALAPSNMPGRLAPALFEPFRGLRDFIAQRITQEFVPGARAALLVEPRPAKPIVEKRSAPAM